MRVRRERDIPEGCGLVLGKPPAQHLKVIYVFIAAEQASNDNDGTVAEMCRVLGVSRSGFYGWLNRAVCDRELSDRALAVQIKAIWKRSDCTYGAPRVHRWPRRQDFRVGCKRVAPVMAANNYQGVCGRRRVRTSIVEHPDRAACDLVGRDFNPAEGDVGWCGDITYLHISGGWLLLATVIDLFSRRVIGWSAAAHMRSELTAEAIKMAAATQPQCQLLGPRVLPGPGSAGRMMPAVILPSQPR